MKVVTEVQSGDGPVCIHESIMRASLHTGAVGVRQQRQAAARLAGPMPTSQDTYTCSPELFVSGYVISLCNIMSLCEVSATYIHSV